MDREHLATASSWLTEHWSDGGPQAARAILVRVLERLPNFDDLAVVETADTRAATLLGVAGGSLFVVRLAAVEDGDAVGGHGVSVTRVPLNADRCRVGFTEHYEGTATTTIVRRWSFAFDGGQTALAFETRTLSHDEGGNPAENFARQLAGRLGWPVL